MAVVLVPLIILGSMEAGLRLGGYGYSPSFFVPGNVKGRLVLVENKRFGLRFFPAAIARSPTPTVMEAEKLPETVRVFVFGESAALGDPRPAYGMPRYLEVLLRERWPEARFEVVCVAMTAINSHAILPIARECAGRDGDIWVVYMGNNEMVGPFGAGTIFGPQTPSLGFIRTTLALRSTRTGQMLGALVGLARGTSALPPSWGGMKMFLDQQVPPDDARRGVVHDSFERNLEDIVRAGLKGGAQIVLSTVGVNVKDCPPFASLNARGMTDDAREEWARLYEGGLAAQMAGEWEEAAAWYRQAAALDDQHAELAFRRGECEIALTNREGAREQFQRAVDLDTLPFRADSEINRLIREVADRHRERGVLLVDAAELLGTRVAGEVPGRETFYEHVHLTFDGNYRLAWAMAQAVERLLPARVTGGRTERWVTAETCEARLGLTDWNKAGLYEELMMRLSEAPFTGQSDHLTRMAQYQEERQRIRERLTLEAAGAADAVYVEALRRSPEDHRIHANYAEFLDGVGRLEEAVVQWRLVEELLPHHHVAVFQIGKLLSRKRESVEAEAYLEESLRRRPDLVDAMIELGQLLAREGRPGEATEYYERALRKQPGNAAVYVQMAHAQAAAGDRMAAMESLREAVRLRPSYWQARYYLGVELALTKQIREAEAEFAAVVRLRPDYALAHLNLGVALIRQGRVKEAIESFRETLRLDPENQRAQEYLRLLEPGAAIEEGKEPGR
jgi:tetratricopeptide (TPR) repeat protein